MIRHIVFFTVPADNLEAARKGLSILTQIPHASRLEIGTNIRKDLWDREIDLVVYGEFETEADFHAYKAHPFYEQSTATVKPLRDMRIAADYETQSAIDKLIE